MDHQQNEAQIDMENTNIIAADQTVQDATQAQIENTPAPDVVVDQQQDDELHNEEQQVELGSEEAEQASMQSDDLMEGAVEDEDAAYKSENWGYTSEGSVRAADVFDAQAVADMNSLQSGTEQCYICADDVCYSRILQLSCREHWLCHDCIADPFEQAIQQESCYPPRCCNMTGPLQVEDFEHLLAKSHPELAARYNAKLDEYHMDKRFRRYCGANDCTTFLNPESYEQSEEHNLTTADCPTCNRTTCVFYIKIVFKAIPHECASRLVTLNKDYSKDARFKYCPFCNRPGLLDEGCNHVTCECGEEWCFVCLRKWNGATNHECGQYNDPAYDDEGYDENGYHRDTGVNREGFNRDGFNAPGFDRGGNKVTDFARLERDRLHAPAPRPAGFMDLNDEFFEETAMITFISEREAGIVHETDNFEDLLNIRFPGFRGARGDHGGQGGIGGGHAAQAHGANHEDFDALPPVVDARADDEVRGLNPGGADAGPEADLDQDMGATSDDHALLQDDEGNAEPADNARVDADDDYDQPQAPTAAQIHCQHVWDLSMPGNLCKACTLTCEDFAQVCSSCSVEACGECAHNFAGNALLNWVVVEIVGEDQGGENGDRDAALENPGG